MFIDTIFVVIFTIKLVIQLLFYQRLALSYIRLAINKIIRYMNNKALKHAYLN